jgi:hypothetical protein
LGIEEDCIGTQDQHQTIALHEAEGEEENNNNNNNNSYESCLNIGNPSTE